MKIPSVLPITAAQSRASRFQIGLTQADVIDQSGLPGYKLKQFETGRFVPDMPFLQSLHDFYQGKGIDLSEAPAATQEPEQKQSGAAIVQAVPRAAVLPARMGFIVSDKLTQDEIGDLLEHMDANDNRIYDLLKKGTSPAFFGGHSEETKNENRELFATLAENYLIFRHLQGRNLFSGFDPKSETETHLHLLHNQFIKSSVAQKMIPAEESTEKTTVSSTDQG